MTHEHDSRLHDEIVDLVAAYADGELDAAERARVEAHLASCARCQGELALQRTVAGALSAPAARVAADDEDAHASFEARMREGLRLRAVPSRRRGRAWIAASGWAVAAALGLALVVDRSSPAREPELVPMAEQALREYRARLADPSGVPIGEVDLHALARDAGLGLEVLEEERAQVLGGWRTRIRGEDAVAIAYRYGSRVVIQYVVSRELFERQEVVRRAVEEEGRFVARDGDTTVIGWPIEGAGVLLVGDVPASSLAELRPG